MHQLRSTKEEEDNSGIWAITGKQTEGYHVHLKLDRIPITMELDTGQLFQSCQSNSGDIHND